MKNRYPATCPCGAAIGAGEGEGDRIDGRWTFRCPACQTVPAGAPQPEPLRPVPIPARPASESQGGSYTLLSGHPASAYQAAVFDHFRTGRGSRLVKAVAGSGKTTTMKNAVRYLPATTGRQRTSVLMLAFNVEAADQLKAAIAELEGKGFLPPGHGVRAGTFHSIGMGAIRRFLNLPDSQVTVVDGALKTKRLMCDRIGGTPEGDATVRAYAPFVAKLVGLAKGEGIGCLVPDTDERWWAVVDHHGLYLDSTEATIERGIEIARRVMTWSEEVARVGQLDYDDQLYLVVRWKLKLWQNHVVIADEAQDTNPVRRAILKLALSPYGGRLYAVGDPKQAIYGFTGASNDAMDLIAREFNASELPLTVSYRCARAIVERARTWVPYIEPSETAPEGSVLDDTPLHAALAMLQPTDAILCRQTAPLVTLAYGLIARGRACRIAGKEIGEGLVNLVETQGRVGIDRLVLKLEAWRDREMARFTARGEETRAEAVKDRVDCLLVIIEALPENGRTVRMLIERIRTMFDDVDRGVLTLSTIHKAKGREWERVAILRPELMPSRAARQEWQYEQEVNLMYVAATRAKQELIYVKPEDMTIEGGQRD